MNAFRIKLGYGAKRNLPSDFTGIGIDRPKRSPGRLLARPEFVIVPKSGIFTPRTSPLVNRIRPVGVLDQFSNIGQIYGIHKEVPQLRIGRHARPVRNPNRAREFNRQLQSERRIRPPALHAAFGGEQVCADFFLLRGYGGNLIWCETVSSQRRRLEREGLGWPGLLAGDFTRRHWPLLYAKDGGAVPAIENKKQPVLTQDRDRGNLHSSFLDVDQNRSRFQVVVKEVVVHGLEVPHQFAGVGIQRDDSVAEEILPLPIRSMEIVGR